MITEYTNINTTIAAAYNTDNTARSFLFGIKVEKEFKHNVSFSRSASLGDFSSMDVENSSLDVTGSYLLSNEFGVVLGPDDSEGLKIVSEIEETNCTNSNVDIDFDIILHSKNEPPVVHKIDVTMPTVKFVKLLHPKTEGVSLFI